MDVGGASFSILTPGGARPGMANSAAAVLWRHDTPRYRGWGAAKIQAARAIHRDTAQWEIVGHNTVGGKKRHGGGRAKDGSGLRPSSAQPPPPIYYFLSSDWPRPLISFKFMLNIFLLRSSGLLFTHFF